MASREKGFLAVAVTHQIRLNLLKRMGDVESWLFPSEPMSTLSPGELSGMQEPGRGEPGALRSRAGLTAKSQK